MHNVGGGTHAAPSKGLFLWNNHSYGAADFKSAYRGAASQFSSVQNSAMSLRHHFAIIRCSFTGIAKLAVGVLKSVELSP
jgi:hypothetical protein